MNDFIVNGKIVVWQKYSAILGNADFYCDFPLPENWTQNYKHFEHYFNDILADANHWQSLIIAREPNVESVSIVIAWQ